MNRRSFLIDSSRATLASGLSLRLLSATGQAAPRGESPGSTSPEALGSVLPGTAPLNLQGDLAEQMVNGIRTFLLRRTEEAAQERERLWQRDYQSVEAYKRSVAPNRERFRQIIGAVDSRVGVQSPEFMAPQMTSAQIAQGSGYKVYAVKWPVLGPVVADYGGLDAEGLLLQPDGKAVARLVAIPDADWTPEALAGLAPGVPREGQFARRLVENGCQVMVPMLINREDTYSGIPGIAMTNEPHREWIYRMAYEVGRHVIGFEVQKVLAAVDWFANENAASPLPIGVMGYGEGGLLALYCGALDERIAATIVSGYFQRREELWAEPIYRDVWGLVREFGDAELASLVAPRALIIEASRGPGRLYRSENTVTVTDTGAD